MATWTLPDSCTISRLMFRTHPAHIGSVGGLHRARRERDTHTHTVRRARDRASRVDASRARSLELILVSELSFNSLHD